MDNSKGAPGWRWDASQNAYLYWDGGDYISKARQVDGVWAYEPSARVAPSDGSGPVRSGETDKDCDPPVPEQYSRVPGSALAWYVRVLALLSPAITVVVFAAWAEQGQALALGLLVSLGWAVIPLWLTAAALAANRSQDHQRPHVFPTMWMVWYLRVLALLVPFLFMLVVDGYWGEGTGEDLGVAFLAWGVVGAVSVPLWVASRRLRGRQSR